VQGYTPLVSTLGKLRQKDHEFEDNLGYAVRPQNKQTKTKYI
jgi:hypothetical protein